MYVKRFPHVTPLWVPVSRGIGLTPENLVLAMKLSNYYHLATQWLHCVSDNICNTDFLKNQLPRRLQNRNRMRRRHGIQRYEGHRHAKFPFLLLHWNHSVKANDFLQFNFPVIVLNLLYFILQELLKLKVLEFLDEFSPNVNQYCSSSKLESYEDPQREVRTKTIV